MLQSFKSSASCAAKVTFWLIPYGFGILALCALLIVAAILSIKYPLEVLPICVIAAVLGISFSPIYRQDKAVLSNLYRAMTLANFREWRRKANNRRRVARQRAKRLAAEGYTQPSVLQWIWQGVTEDMLEKCESWQPYYRAIPAVVAWYMAIGLFAGWMFSGFDVKWWTFLSGQLPIWSSTLLVWNYIDKRYLPEMQERILVAASASTLPTIGLLMAGLGAGYNFTSLLTGGVIGGLLIPSSIAFYYRCEEEDLPARLYAEL